MVLSMDLSLSSPAFAVLEYDNKGKVKLVCKSHVNNKKRSKAPHGERLSFIYDELNRILKTYPITEIVREKGFSRYAQTTQTLFKVVGISDLLAHKETGLTVEEIPPTTIKKILAGYGFSSKDAVADELYAYVGEQNYANDDESDAVAVGIVYLMQKGIIKKAA
ncbi:MAG: uncharacterized protein K0S71_307 [Clostridia bacterium]|nr:uncharacterized protein [Clostridia bacterium]